MDQAGKSRVFGTSLLVWMVSSIGFMFSARAFCGQKIVVDFSRYFDSFSLYSEQILVDQLPILANPSTIPAFIHKKFSNAGDLPVRYRPSGQNVFPITTFLVDPSFCHVVTSSDTSPDKKGLSELVVGSDGCRLFIHPLEAAKVRKLLNGKFNEEPARFFATPSSSARSLFVWDSVSNKRFVAKLSLDQEMGTSNRMIQPYKAKRAVAITWLMSEAMEESNGQLPISQKHWHFFDESVGAFTDHEAIGSFILREWDIDTKNFRAVPWFSLVANQGVFLNTLYARQRELDPDVKKLEFVWSNLVKPLVEMHCYLSFVHGFTTELHQQNTLLLLDLETNRPEGIGIRDADGNGLDFGLRTYAIGRQPVVFESLAEDMDFMNYHRSQRNHLLSYFRFLRGDSVKRIFRPFLGLNDTVMLLRRTDQFLVERFNQEFPDYSIENISEYQQALSRMHSELIPADFQEKIYAASYHKHPTYSEKMIQWWNKHLEYLEAPLDAFFDLRPKCPC